MLIQGEGVRSYLHRSRMGIGVIVDLDATESQACARFCVRHGLPSHFPPGRRTHHGLVQAATLPTGRHKQRHPGGRPFNWTAGWWLFDLRRMEPWVCCWSRHFCVTQQAHGANHLCSLTVEVQPRRHLPAQLTVLPRQTLYHVPELNGTVLGLRQHRRRQHHVANVTTGQVRHRRQLV